MTASARTEDDADLGRAVQRGDTDARVADFTRSIEVDAALAADDIAGSIAHVHGLGRAGLLTDDEVDDPGRRPRGARRRRRPPGALAWDPGLEDVHMNLEAALAEKVGPLAGKLHTGRSRNDQVATDLRLWTRRAIDELDAALRRLRAGAGRARRARRDGGPARARPTSSRPSRSCSPITCWPTSRWPSATAAAWPTRAGGSTSRRSGSGALAGAGYPLDRAATAAELGFDGVSANSMDAVSDRDFVVETLAADRARDGPPEPAGRGDHVVVEPAVRVRPRRRRVLDRQLDDAQQEEPRPGRAGPRPRGPRHRRADRGPRRCSRACRWRTSATSRMAWRRCSTRSPSTTRRSG